MFNAANAYGLITQGDASCLPKIGFRKRLTEITARVDHITLMFSVTKAVRSVLF